MKGRIVLFSPAPRSGYQTPRRVELPLGLLSISTQLDKEGYDVKIIDEFADPEWKQKLKRVRKSSTSIPRARQSSAY